MLSALILDIDGTLLDSNGAHVEAWVDALAAHGDRIPADRVRAEVGKGGDQLLPAILGEGVAEREGAALRHTRSKRRAELIAFRRAGARIPPGARDLVLATTLESCVMCTGGCRPSGVAAYSRPGCESGPIPNRSRTLSNSSL